MALLDVMPWNTIPAAFGDWPLIGVAIVAIFPIAFATIPESAAHVNQIDLYVNDLASQRPENKDYGIRNMLDDNLIGDGVGESSQLSSVVLREQTMVKTFLLQRSQKTSHLTSFS